MPGKTYVQATINGEHTDFLCEPRQSLLEVLRDVIGLTGTKEGCNDGNCGACTIILDGRIVTPCLVLAVEAEGKEMTTIEGIASGSTLHPIQQSFLENAALQCGICTPGFIVATKALLDENPNPTEYEIRFWLANNLCRCTGYDKIIRAVQDAATTGRTRSPAGPCTAPTSTRPGCCMARSYAAPTLTRASSPSTRARPRPCPACWPL